MERAFKILQARFSIIRGSARDWSIENLQYIMMTCIILMIIEDKHEEDELKPFDPKDIPTLPEKAKIYDWPNGSNSSSSCSSSTIIKIIHVIMMYWRFSLLQPQDDHYIIENEL